MYLMFLILMVVMSFYYRSFNKEMMASLNYIRHVSGDQLDECI